MMKRISFDELEAFKRDYQRISAMMKQGIQKDRKTGLEYFTGYSYNTLYDWDQYFEAVIQLYLGWDTTFIKNGVTIFLDNQSDDGFIMRRIKSTAPETQNANLDERTQYITEQEDTEMVKPFLAQISLMLYKQQGHILWLAQTYYEKMKKYIEYWLNEKDINKNGLSTWDSAPHSGMDDQIDRVGGWHANFCEGVDLNSFLYRECRAFSKIASILGNHEDETLYEQKAQAIKQSIQEKMWCEEDGFFYDLNEKTGKMIKVKSSSGFSPLWAGIATTEQAHRMITDYLINPKVFWRPFPVSSYAATEPGYREERLPEDVGCNWRAQTWIPVNYYIMHGLMDYGYLDLASQLAQKTYDMVKKIGDREYYNSDSCTGNGLDPFWGWSLLAYFMPMEIELGLNPTRIDLDLRDIALIKVL